MKNDYYIVQDGELKRKENTVYFENEQTRRALPINRINALFCYGSVSLSSGVILFLGKKGIPVHFFDYYGWYKSSLYPRETLISGDLVVKQAECYLTSKKRLLLAKKFVEGANSNILRNLKYYAKDSAILLNEIDEIISLTNRLPNSGTIPEVMQIEGKVREHYYHAIDNFVPEKYAIVVRRRRPPNNRMNTLISFGNSKLYTTVLSEIYNTQLHPAISYLHEPFERRFSLALDVAEIFKPILVDRVIFKLVNKNMLNNIHFDGKLGDMLLSERGRKIFLKEYDTKLKRTIKHKGLRRNVSYRRLIRLELYKIIKHILGQKDYRPLVMWW